MSRRNNHDEKAARREQRLALEEQRAYMAAVQFALQAQRSTEAVPLDTLDDAIAYGDALIKPGISLDDALEVQAGQQALRALRTYRRALENPHNPEEDADAD